MNDLTFLAPVEKKRCLVLGGTGFIGVNLVKKLLSLGYSVRLFTRFNLNRQKFPDSEKLEIIVGDIQDENLIAKAVLGCEVCFHLISTVLPGSSNLDPVFDIESNLLFTVKLLNCLAKSKIEKIIFLSSGGTVYGQPTTLPIVEAHSTNPRCSYGIVKLAIEKYLSLYHQLYGLNYVVLRLSNPFGEYQSVKARQGAVAVFLGRALCGQPVEIWGDGSVVRDYVYISDAVSALSKALFNDQTTGNIYSVVSGESVSELETAFLIKGLANRPLDVEFKPGNNLSRPKIPIPDTFSLRNLNWQPKISFKEVLCILCVYYTLFLYFKK